MIIRHSVAGAVVALGLSMTAQAAFAGSAGQDAPVLKEQARSTFTLVKGGKGMGGHHHGHRGGGFWWGAPLIVAPFAYQGSCYADCREYRGPRYCHARCGY